MSCRARGGWTMRMRLMTVGALIATGFSSAALAADGWTHGTISNLTSTPSGLMIMIDAGVPTNCTGVSYGWMTIPEANKAMIVTTLIAWQMGRAATVYTNPLSGGVCTISQLDPAES